MSERDCSRASPRSALRLRKFCASSRNSDTGRRVSGGSAAWARLSCHSWLTTNEPSNAADCSPSSPLFRVTMRTVGVRNTCDSWNRGRGWSRTARSPGRSTNWRSRDMTGPMACPCWAGLRASHCAQNDPNPTGSVIRLVNDRRNPGSVNNWGSWMMVASGACIKVNSEACSTSEVRGPNAEGNSPRNRASRLSATSGRRSGVVASGLIPTGCCSIGSITTTSPWRWGGISAKASIAKSRLGSIRTTERPAARSALIRCSSRVLLPVPVGPRMWV